MTGERNSPNIPVMSDNKNLHNSKINKNDEYYTLTSDIARYVPYFSHLFENKVIYCNCDNYKTSNFFKFLQDNFFFYRIKRLVATCYNGNGHSFGFIKTRNGEKRFDLAGNGDFRSDECVSILKHSDIVITNPPFTLFRDFISQLFEYEKDFIIIGHLTSSGYKAAFPNFMNGRLFAIDNYSQDFDTPKGEISPVNCMWFTTFYCNHPELRLTEWYHPDRYPKFVNYDAIYVDKIREIPKDYYGVMGVPLTFLSQHNNEQFEILGITRGYCNMI